jgi:tetratricopeptide (TPR) repeat protein
VSDARSDPEADLDARLRSEGKRLRTSREGCPLPDVLVARATGMLDAELGSTLDTHLDGCEACRRLAADIDALDLATPGPLSDKRVSSRVFGPAQGRGWLLPLAAALVLASGGAAVWRVWPRAMPVADRHEAAVAPPAAPRGDPAPIVALWTVAPAPVRVPLSSLGATRGGEAPRDPGTLFDALAPYQAGDYTAAVARLSEWVRTSPASGEGYFYLGVSQLLAGDPQAAAASLARASDLLPASRRREVEWYRAAADQRSGNVTGARLRLQSLCAEAGAYRAEACAADAVLR